MTAAGLANTGTINLTGGTAAATLDITTAAPATLTGNFNLAGDALLEFASGGITALGTGTDLTLERGQGAGGAEHRADQRQRPDRACDQCRDIEPGKRHGADHHRRLDQQRQSRRGRQRFWRDRRQQPDNRRDPDQSIFALYRQHRPQQGDDGDRGGVDQFQLYQPDQRHGGGDAESHRRFRQHRNRRGRQQLRWWRQQPDDRRDPDQQQLFFQRWQHRSDQGDDGDGGRSGQHRHDQSDRRHGGRRRWTSPRRRRRR